MLIKDVYNEAFYKQFGKVAEEAIPSFSTKQYTRLIFEDNFETLEWKQRLNLSTKVLHHFMPADFVVSAGYLVEIINRLKRGGHYTSSFPYLFFQDYIATFGLDHFKVSMESIRHITTFISGEFAIRPFILKYENEAIELMLNWADSEDEHVRRLSSEGSRPRLPWGTALKFLKLNPSPILPILEKLKNDPSEYVRRSVANSLNDIGKDHPDILLNIAAKWKGHHPDTDRIIKHACRNLLKQGHPEILNYYGLEGKNANVTEFRILNEVVGTGEYLQFEFQLQNNISVPQLIRLEYAVYYLKSNGEHSKKVFKISEKEYAAGELIKVSRRQSFKLITTRTFYPGLHYLSVIANGSERERLSFNYMNN